MSLLNGVEVALLRIPRHHASDRLNRNHAPNRALKHHLGHGPICRMLRLAGCQSRYARCQFLQQATTRKGSSDTPKKNCSATSPKKNCSATSPKKNCSATSPKKNCSAT